MCLSAHTKYTPYFLVLLWILIIWDSEVRLCSSPTIICPGQRVILDNMSSFARCYQDIAAYQGNSSHSLVASSDESFLFFPLIKQFVYHRFRKGVVRSFLIFFHPYAKGDLVCNLSAPGFQFLLGAKFPTLYFPSLQLIVARGGSRFHT